MICFLFYLLAVFIVFSAVMVIYVPNPVYSVLFLIFTFFLSSALFILLGTELIAMLIVIVYVGAVAVLFLFVVMMLDIDYSRFRQGFIKYFIIGFVCAAVFFVNLSFIIKHSSVNNIKSDVSIDSHVENVVAIGSLIYTKYMYVFHLSGVLLLVAIVGSLVLTLNHRPDVRRQNVRRQVLRSSSIKLVDVKFGEGISENFD